VNERPKIQEREIETDTIEKNAGEYKGHAGLESRAEAQGGENEKKDRWSLQIRRGRIQRGLTGKRGKGLKN